MFDELCEVCRNNPQMYSLLCLNIASIKNTLRKYKKDKEKVKEKTEL